MTKGRLPKQVLETLHGLREEKKLYLEIKKIKGRFCVYNSTSRWSKEKKKPVKKTYYFGTIQPTGKFIGRKKGMTIPSEREVFEYGNCTLAYCLLKDVECYLKERCSYTQELIVLAILRAINPQPLRLVSSAWEKYSISKNQKISLNPKHLSEVLHATGSQIQMLYDFFSYLSKDNDILFYDLSHFFSNSKELLFAEKGYNPEHSIREQIGVGLAFSYKQTLPIGIDVFFGSMRDITTLNDFAQRYKRKNICLVLDRGFASYELTLNLKREKTHYILPLKKNAKIINYNFKRDRTFSYRNRNILWGKDRTKYGFLYLFEDPRLKGSQENQLLKKVTEKKLTVKEFQQRRKSCGIIPLLSDLDLEGEKIFGMYKCREDIELVFDTFKNHLEMDKIYLRSNEKVRGYFIVGLLAARIYFSILKRLREKELISKVSVAEVILELSKIHKIIEPNGREYFSKIPKKATEYQKIFQEHMG